MKLSEPITISPRWWRILDIAAVVLMLGGFAVIYAIGSGTWNPLGSVTIEIWPGLLYATYLMIAILVTLLFGFQLAASEAHEGTVQEAAAKPSPRAAVVPEGVGSASATPLMEGPSEPATAIPARGAEPREPALTGAGR